MGQVGNDPFGEFLEQTLQHAHVDTSMLIRDKQTTLAFVSIDEMVSVILPLCVAQTANIISIALIYQK